jgi:hypothetical protein
MSIHNFLGSTLKPTTTRPPVVPSTLTNINFDVYDQLNGWHTDYSNYRWLQTNGNLSNSLGMYSPGSDYKSISTITFNVTNLIKTGLKCSIPFCDNNFKEQYYCKKLLTTRKDLVCVHKECPETPSTSSNYGKCDLGYYMMTRYENYATPVDSFRSRFISPVYGNQFESMNLCISFKYNIYGDNEDGFQFYLENYQNGDEVIKIWKISGPLPLNKWYSVSLELKNLRFKQFRVT